MHNYAAEFIIKALKQVKPLVITIILLIALYNNEHNIVLYYTDYVVLSNV